MSTSGNEPVLVEQYDPVVVDMNAMFTSITYSTEETSTAYPDGIPFTDIPAEGMSILEAYKKILDKAPGFQSWWLLFKDEVSTDIPLPWWDQSQGEGIGVVFSRSGAFGTNFLPEHINFNEKGVFNMDALFGTCSYNWKNSKTNYQEEDQNLADIIYKMQDDDGMFRWYLLCYNEIDLNPNPMYGQPWNGYGPIYFHG